MPTYLKHLAPFALALLATSQALAADPTPTGIAAPPAPAEVPAMTPIGAGPYRAVMEVDPSLSTHTLYHPAEDRKSVV